MRRKEKLDVEADCAWMWMGVAPIWNFKCAGIVAIERYDSVDKAIESCPITHSIQISHKFLLRMSISFNMRWPKDGPRTVIFSASGVAH